MKNEIKHTLFSVLFFCFGFLLLLCALFFLSFSAKQNQIKVVSESIQRVLEDYNSGNYEVGENILISSPVASSAFLFELSVNDEIPAPAYVGLLRIAGFSGSFPLLLISSKEKGIFVAGVMVDNKSLKSPADYNISNLSLKLAEQNFSKILAGAVQE